MSFSKGEVLNPLLPLLMVQTTQYLIIIYRSNHSECRQFDWIPSDSWKSKTLQSCTYHRDEVAHSPYGEQSTPIVVVLMQRKTTHELFVGAKS